MPSERPLLDSEELDNKGAQQDRQPDGVQPGGDAAPGSKGQLLHTAQHPQASTRTSTSPKLVHGHTVGGAESWDLPEEGEDV